MIPFAPLLLAAAIAAEEADSGLAAPALPVVEVPQETKLELASEAWSTTDRVVLGSLPVATLALTFADEPMRDFAQENRSDASLPFAKVGKALGDARLVLPSVGLIAWTSWSGRSPRLARASVNALEAWTLTQFVAQMGKYTVGRSRPRVEEGNLSFHGIQISRDQFHSFPSGHTSTAWGILPAYAMEFSDQPWIAGSLYAAASLTALSRVHDDQHWLSDVVCAGGIGWLSNRAVRSWNASRAHASATSVSLLPLSDGWDVRMARSF